MTAKRNKFKAASKMTYEELAEHSREVHWLPDNHDHEYMLHDHDYDHKSGAVKTAPADKVHTHGT